MRKVSLSLSIEEASTLYEIATSERKLELEELFPELKPKDIRDRVKTYEDALKVLGRNHFNETNLYLREIARRKLEIIIEALNEGWKPDLNNHQEYKWYCYFSGAVAGLGCSYSSYSPTYALTYFGVLFCLKDKKLADYIGEQFKYLYEEMLLG